MKNIYPVIICLFIGLLFSACGDDDPVNPGTPSGTVLYSRDSLSVWLQPSTFAEGSDSVYYSISTAAAVRVEFTLQSNADSTHARGYYFFTTNSSVPEPYVPNVLAPIDELRSYTLDFSPLSSFFSFAVRLIVNSSAVPYYVRLKNIKVTKL